jgi:ElaB/YqjD/DUF883 family membrane-anchored ribosome-binding protein
MADTNYPSSNVVAHGGGPAPLHGTASDRAGTVVGEFVEAAREAAESLLEEQKRQIAARIGGVAEGLRSAADPLHRSQNRILSRYVERAAEQVEGFSRTLRDRRWNELVAETEEFARRQPTWFVLGAVATGFLVGRLFWASAASDGDAGNPNRASAASETRRSVTAAVSSGSGTGEVAGYSAGASGAMESR